MRGWQLQQWRIVGNESFVMCVGEKVWTVFALAEDAAKLQIELNGWTLVDVNGSGLRTVYLCKSPSGRSHTVEIHRVQIV